MEKSEATVWMPYKEYLAHKEWKEKMSEEMKQKMAYFFWNNFSYEGYEEWKLKTINNAKNID